MRRPTLSRQGTKFFAGSIGLREVPFNLKRFTLFLWLWLTAFSSGWGESLDYTALPKRNDNFLEASFRFIIPSPKTTVTTVLVYVPGTDGDGRGAVSDPQFLALGNVCDAAVVGCYYRGEGLSYDDPRGGSGRALDEALSYFATKSGQPQISSVKLFLVGLSQGGMFTFNYVCWHPQRVKAFAALRAVFPKYEPRASSFQVPGILAAGEYDQSGRIRAIATAFTEARGQDSKWAFLWEKQSGHTMGRSLDLVSAFFKAVSQDGPANLSSYCLDTMTRETGDPSYDLANRCWFPNHNVAKIWISIHRPTSLETLIALPDKPRLQDLISVVESPDVFQCRNGECQMGSICLSTLGQNLTIDQIKVNGDGFVLMDSTAGKLPSEFKVCFAPKNMPWGETRADVTIRGRVDGRDAEPFNATLVAKVGGPLKSIPSTVYLGVIVPGQVTRKTILLQSDHTEIHFSGVRVPDGVTVTIGTANKDGDFPLRIRWVGGSRLGRMQGQVEIAVDRPEKGVLRIPILGLIAGSSSTSTATNHYFLSDL